MSKKKQYTFSSLLFLFLLVMPLSSWAQGIAGCDRDFVNLGEKAIEVIPTGIDDTANIQCALDGVGTIFGGVPGVRLSAGDFFISSIVVENYKGYFQGETRDTTSLVVLNGSVNCAAMHSAGQAASALKFIKGEPVVRYMTIELGITSATSKPTAIKGKRGDKTKPQAVQIVSPCLDSSTPLDSFINFTGRPAEGPGCGNDVVFAEVDRTNFFGGGRGSELVFTGILAASESNMFGGDCGLLGQVTVNQSWIGNFDSGVFTALRGGAHVDVTFNTFWDNSYGLFITNSNQTTTVSNNIFDVLETGSSGYSAGLYGTASAPDAPRTTSMNIFNNNFRFEDTQDNTMDAVGLYNADGDAPPQNVGVFIANNTFDLAGDDVAGIWSDTVNNGTVTGNAFSGGGLVAVEVLADDGFPVFGWTITGNGDLRNITPLDPDIWIGPGVNDTFIGDGQFHTLHDEGTNTHSFGDVPIDQPVSLEGKVEKRSSRSKARNHSTKFLEMLKKR
ncbi:MAG: hypothetical protein IMF09_13080 [Proteobacteria bacterium]|nr:hypothetical protein [Pseudomonadota bacterium]